MRRVAGTASLSLLALFLGAASIAADTPWQISASPTSLVEGQQTQVVLTVTGGTQMIGLVAVTIPSGYIVKQAAVISQPQKGKWTATISATLVTFWTKADPQRIGPGDVANFSITVVPTSPSPPPWTAIACQYWSDDPVSCLPGSPATRLPGFGVPPASTPAPTPTTGPDQPTPTPIPTPTPTPGPDQPTPAATPTLAPTPGQSSASLQPSSPTGATPKASPSIPPTASQATASPDAPFGGGTQVEIPQFPTSGSIDITGVDGFSSLGLHSWLVPGFFLGLPGIMILLAVLLQVGSGALLLPVVRHFLGGVGPKSRRSHVA